MSTGLEPLSNQPRSINVASRHSVVSPYYSPDGFPVTSGDYEQRIKDRLKAATESMPPWIRWFTQKKRDRSRGLSILTMATTLVVGSALIVYFANVAVVREKESKIIKLLEERQLLRHKKEELLKLSHPSA
ncbi:hypothetical protein BDV3_004080 [Batrachochytrium dendrobatidis]|uniref:Uncharacterized protein n=1 Tax=Batrachochytrium dendrobatidis (strain JEL423) TaxID=403673 RepID=A0A177WEK5_BATDL|nr:hypothetical protein BDEG_22458 [Batrachochytrium dendrobatidis JEL423]